MKKFHGVFSLLLFISALILAAYSICIQNFTLGIAYSVAIPTGFLVIAGVFCSRCPCAPNNCSHVLVGYLTIPFKKKEGNYKLSEYIWTGVVLAVLIGVPQYWLFQEYWMAIVFWGLSLLAGIEINLFVCKQCGNKFCGMCKNKEIKQS